MTSLASILLLFLNYEKNTQNSDQEQPSNADKHTVRNGQIFDTRDSGWHCVPGFVHVFGF
jgi:hypothetical protein